ncbi:alpha/beta hydrolase [Pelagibius sp. Alg239-R121]|uniref:alpha/beta hydrolase n=1 Tax=Pelagibius sp. Alg239-R121 TaxID=2993448 RepID=UPI0024A682AF|nr:alpha/beta hydrolase [Pelagibius sp. Alg239-R121]
MTFLWLGLFGYMLLLAAMFLFQRSLLYPAGTSLPDIAMFGVPGLREVELTTKDGLIQKHWYVPARAKDAPTVVVFHGNAGQLADRVPKYLFFTEAGYGVFFVGYRGYAGNEGSPTQNDLLEDAGSVLDWLAEEGIPSDKTVLYGESLGSGVAVQTAAERKVGALVLEAPFTSVAEVAQSHYWYLPARWLILDKWNSLAHADQLTAPVLVLHGERDAVTDVRFGRRLLEAIQAPKEGIFVPEAGHNDLYSYGLRDRVTGFIGQTLPAQ